MRSFISHYKPERAWIVNLSLESEIVLDDTTLRFLPFWKLV